MWIIDLAARRAETVGFPGTAEVFRELSRAESEGNESADGLKSGTSGGEEDQKTMLSDGKMRAND